MKKISFCSSAVSLIFFFLGFSQLRAQGPIAASCSPATTAYCCNFGITNVTFNTINYTTGYASDGYKDYSATVSTTVYAGSTYNISVSTPQPAPHNVMVWIDYNNNGSFDPTTELAFSSASTTVATGTVAIPGSVVFNTPLRMRVSADYEANAIPTPCGNLEYGQAEDYSVTIISNTNPPVANFTATPTTTCSGNVNFTDNSTNVPTSWAWNFGDGNTSTQQNPTHTYASSGTYTVTLVATNAFGSNTKVKSSYINVTLGNTPVAASCTPTTTGYCCGYGIYNVTLNTINNTTANGSEGYKDYSCAYQTTLTQGEPYTISIQTSATDAQDSRVWIDLNNNGIFETTELLFTSNNSFNPSGTFMVSGGAVLNTPLRMRVFSDYAGSNPNSCSNASYGQAEDYTVVVVPNTNPPIVSFSANKLSTCDGIIAFKDSSSRVPTSWLWNFGDGTTSTLQNPTHTYTSIGTYSVTLTATNAYGSGSLTKTSYINVISTTGSPVAASCTPTTTSYCCGIGIYNVTLNSINNTTANGGSDGYKDYSCSKATVLTAGQSYSISIRTGTSYSEYVKVWIDFNNNGTFNTTTEQVFSDYALTNHTATITIPGTAALNTTLRMRVASDYNTVDPCTNVMYGQVEDYMVTIVPNTNPPITDFSASTTTVTAGSSVTFTDLSSSVPTTWNWTFTGGTPSTSTIQNPTVVYNTLGTYAVKLRVSNSYGADSITKTAYINVINAINMCSSTTSALVSGNLYDSGGPTGNYNNYENCNLLIDPGCATSITMTFSAFNTESGYDYLRIYNGVNASAPLLLSASGSSIPASVTANSGKMYITFTSDGSYATSGFAASWSSVVSSAAPVANFSMSNSNPPAGTAVSFTDISTNSPTMWEWNFGNGATSTLQNPTYTYTAAGTYTVTLIAKKCTMSDTITRTITVTAGPDISVNPTSFNVTLSSCRDSVIVPMYISNNGGSNLSYTITGTGGGTPDVLALTYGVDMTLEYPNTISAINQYYTNYNLTTINTTSASALQTALVGKEVFLVAEQESGTSSVFSGFATVLQNFVTNGGTVIFCGSSSSYSSSVFSTGLFSGNSVTDIYSNTNTLNVVNTHPITNSLPATINSYNATNVYNITNSNIVRLITYSGNDVVSYRTLGNGKIIYVGFDYFDYTNVTNNWSAKVISNAVSWAGNSSVSWLSASPVTGTVVPADSTLVNVKFKANGMAGGQYITNLVINSNDPLNPSVSVPCTLNVSLKPCVSYTANSTTSCNGIITFANTTSGGTSYSWNFGDGTTSTQQNPTHTYTANGTYTVTLIACNTYGCDTLVKTNYMNITLGGPVSASCSPITTGYCCGRGIYNVTFNTINNTTADGVDGYQDYSCTKQTTVTASNTYSIPIRTGTGSSENVKVWIDYNNDGVFNTTNEEVYSNYGYQNHTGNIVIPSTATLNVPLRMRVASDYYSVYSCANVTYGQMEDYTINIQPNTNPPVANFTATPTTTCNGIITFANATTNGTSFVWYFGDGTTSTQQTPTHSYAANGTYSVKLVSCNPYGCDSIVKANYVNVTLGAPINASCSPITTGNCCGLGIYNVTLNSINNTTADGVDGFQDYTCSQQTTVIAGQSYSISVRTGTSYSEYVKVWIDYNNDGVFNTSNEQVFSSYQTQNHSGTITFPTTASLNVPLRMRVASDYSDVYSCTNVTYGQMEDYTVKIQPNNTPPVVSFSSTSTTSCNGIITFVNTTTNGSSYSWNFGDGTTSTQQNPTHTYSANGTYTVTLISCNAYGCDTLIKTGYINISLGGPIAASCTPITTSYCCARGIYNVTFNTINNTTSYGIDGYQDYSCTQQTTVTASTSYAISVRTGNGSSENVKVWIDFNNDGTFNSSNEEVFANYALQNHTGTIVIPSTATLNVPLRMRVASDYYTVYPCTNVTYGQMEDYAIIIQPNTNPPAADFIANVTTVNLGGAVSFTDLTSNSPTSWSWSFPGATPSFSNAQNPTVNYNTAGVYPVTLTVSNGFGSDAITKTAYINVINSVNLCSGSSSVSASGTIYDSGGPSANYGSSENCSFLIDPGCVSSIKLTFSDFRTENGYDYLNVYNGTNASAPLLLSATGNTLPSPVTANSGKMFITFRSDGSVSYQGFEASWTSVNSSGLVADFSVDDTLVKDTSSVFTNISTGGFTSFWDFGDGTTSTLNNPTHSYALAGTYQVTLTITDTTNGCTSTISKFVTVVLISGIDKLANSNSLIVFPNPSNQFLNINYTFKGERDLNVTIYNLLGEKVFSEAETKVSEYKKTLDISNYSSGAYMLRIQSGNDQVSRVINVVR